VEVYKEFLGDKMDLQHVKEGEETRDALESAWKGGEPGKVQELQDLLHEQVELNRGLKLVESEYSLFKSEMLLNDIRSKDSGNLKNDFDKSQYIDTLLITQNLLENANLQILELQS